MSKTLTDILQNLPTERRKKIADRCASLVYQELNHKIIAKEENSSLSQIQEITVYLFPDTYHCVRSLSEKSAEYIGNIIEKSIILYFAYQNTLNNDANYLGTPNQEFDFSTTQPITIFLSKPLLQELTQKLGDNTNLISGFINQSLQFYNDQVNHDSSYFDHEQVGKITSEVSKMSVF